MGGAVFPPCCLTWGQTMVEVMKIMATSFKRSHALLHSVPLTLKQATVNPSLHQRLLDTPRQVWVSLLWGHCSYRLGPGVHKVQFMIWATVNSKSCFCWLHRASPSMAADYNQSDLGIDRLVMPMCWSLLLCCWKRVFAMTSVFSWQNSISLCPASFCTPRPNMPISPGISWLLLLHSSSL